MKSATGQIQVTQHFNIISADSGDSAQQVLAIRIGEQHVGFAISEKDNKELSKLVWYDGEPITVGGLQEVFESHPELRQSFHKILIGYDHPMSLLIPPGLPQHDPRSLLETMYGINGKHTLIKEQVDGWQLQNVYAVPTETQDWIRRHFPAAESCHCYSIGMRQINAADVNGSLLVDLRSHDFTVLASQGNSLLLAQTFLYISPADVIYNLIKICKEFSLTREAAKLSLSGLVAKESNLYRELDHYFLDVSFREPDWIIRGEEDYPRHFFTSLNDLALCAS